MRNFYVTLAAVAALLAMPAASAPAFAEADCPIAKAAAAATTARTDVAALAAPAETDSVRQVDLQVEPIQPPEDAAQPSNQPEDQPDDQSAAPSDSTDASAEPTAESSGAAAVTDEPVTAKRICRKFSAAIAMVIEVPCE